MDLFNVIALDALRSLTAMDGTCNIEQNGTLQHTSPLTRYIFSLSKLSG